MAHPCRLCGRLTGLYLHRGKLYCIWCLPMEELPQPARSHFLLQRCQATREARRGAWGRD